MRALEALRFIGTLPKLPHVERGQPEQEIVRGIRWGRSRENPFHVLRLHYTADPDKDPERDGQKWYAAKTADMGGASSSGWQREYEIDFKAQAGAKVFGNFNERHKVEPRVLPRWFHRWVVWDYGLRNPTVMLVIATNDLGVHEVELEYYQRGASVKESAYAAHRLVWEMYADAELRRQVAFDDEQLLIGGRDKLEEWESQFFQGVIGDPSMGELREKDTKTVLERFAECGWFIAKGIRATHGLGTVNTWFKEDLLFIQKRCVNTIREVSYLVWADHADPTLNYREREVDKDNHSTDCLKMFANQFPSDADRPVPNEQADLHHRDQEYRALMEQQRWEQENGGMMLPTYGGYE